MGAQALHKAHVLAQVSLCSSLAVPRPTRGKEPRLGTHCPNVQIPPGAAPWHNLLVLPIHTRTSPLPQRFSSLKAWASIPASFHLHTKMQLPLLSHQFPKSQLFLQVLKSQLESSSRLPCCCVYLLHSSVSSTGTED